MNIAYLPNSSKKRQILSFISGGLSASPHPLIPNCSSLGKRDFTLLYLITGVGTGGGKGGMCPPPLFRVEGKDMFVPPPHFQTQNLGMCPPPILSRSYAVAYI